MILKYFINVIQERKKELYIMFILLEELINLSSEIFDTRKLVIPVLYLYSYHLS